MITGSHPRSQVDQQWEMGAIRRAIPDAAFAYGHSE
jgi:hypothetical protein